MKELDDILKKFKETAQIQQQPDVRLEIISLGQQPDVKHV